MLSQRESRDAAIRTRIRYVSNFTTASCGFSATACHYCIHRRPFKCWNYTQYAKFHDRNAKPRR